ncbi:hypothetical protein A9Q81_27835 [Gammaproteobacteria bacterium 42_54_T18]|nr:hypothetical protein A9Q81_27835 [Gammaproteobacteria bacterium 42_54_T18]
MSRYPINGIYTALKIADSLGASGEALLKRCDLSEEDLCRAGATISKEEFNESFVFIEELVPRNRIPSHVMVELFPISEGGLLSVAAMSSNNIRQAIGLLAEYLPRVLPNIMLNLTETTREYILELVCTESIGSHNSMFLEYLLGMIAKGKDLVETPINIDINIAHSCPFGTFLCETIPYGNNSSSNMFPDSSMNFNASNYSIRIFKENADTALASRNSSNFSLYKKMLSETVSSNLPATQSELTSAYIEKAIVNSRRITVELAAEEFTMSTRTLARRLAVENTSFQVLLMHKKVELAYQYLRYTRKPISQISSQLGYETTNSFSRAFKKESGMTPLVFRKIQQT